MPIPDHPEAAQLRRFEERIEAEAITHTTFRSVRIGGHGRDLDPADIVVEGEVSDGEVAQRITAGCGVAGDLGIAQIGVVAIKRAVAEVPHQLGRHLGVVGVEQGKRQSGDVVVQRAVGRERNLRMIFLGRRSVRRRPFELLARHDIHHHPALHQRVIARAHEILHQGGVSLRDHVTRLHLRIRRT